jgi:hypothetical protein
VFTNYPFQEYREIANKLGADHFFDKATEFDEVQECWQRCYRARKLRRRQ